MNLAEHLTWIFLAIRVAVDVPAKTLIPVSTREIGLWAGKYKAQNPQCRQIKLSTGHHAFRKVMSPFFGGKRTFSLRKRSWTLKS